MRLACAIAALGLAAAQSPAVDPLRATHDALFASFLPLETVQEKPELTRMFLGARDGLWLAAGEAPDFRTLITPFVDLRSFGAACGLSDFLNTTGTTAFAQLSAAQRAHILLLLYRCSSSDPRRLVMRVRNFYLSKTYGPLQEPLTGVKLNLFAPDPFIKQHRPKLPATRLSYDREKKEITLQGGEIDYLIVGSGPAGSVLGHELRRGGKRVVLLERGPFTVPGAMETRLVDELKAHAAAERCTPAQLALAWLLSRKKFVVPIAGTSHVRWLEENAAAAGLRLSADTEDALGHVFAPGIAAGTRYGEDHLARLLI